jgi:alpha-methylacyl-CoA racemase
VDRAHGENEHHVQFEAHVKGDWVDPRKGMMDGGARSVAVDLKHPKGAEVVLRLIDKADAFVEGFRPGVAERLGIGPDACLARNPRLVYTRMTGWGQTGPLANVPGHDFNYVAIAGALGTFGREGEVPLPPLNLLGDVASALHGALATLAGIFEARESGQGQVIDAAIVDSTAYFMGTIYLMRSMGVWTDRRGSNLMDGGAPFLNVYECSDGKFVTVTAFERPFWSDLLQRLGLDGQDLPDQMERECWPLLCQKLADVFRTKTRDEWTALLEMTDACVSPVLSLDEAPNHPHNKARNTFFSDNNGVLRPASAPRFSRSTPQPPAPRASTPEGRRATMRAFGFSDSEIDDLVRDGVVA